MSMVCGADDDGINILLVEQLAKIAVSFRPWKLLLRGGEKSVVYVAKRNDVLMFNSGDI